MATATLSLASAAVLHRGSSGPAYHEARAVKQLPDATRASSRWWHPGPDRLAGAIRGGRQAGCRAGRAARHAPVSLGLLTVLWLLALGTGSVLNGPPGRLRAHVLFSGIDPWQHPLSLPLSLFWSTGLRGYVVSTLALLVLGVLTERRLGSARYASTLALTHLGALLVAAVTAAGVMRLLSLPSVGLEYGGLWCAVIGAVFGATGSMSTLWRRRVRVGGLALLTTTLLYNGGDLALLGLLSALVGLAVTRRRHPPAWAVDAVGSVQEARAVGALVVAATAAGPLLAAVNPAASGPFAVTAYLMAPVRGARQDVVTQLCTEAATSPACTLGALHVHQGVGTALLASLPAVLLLVAAAGMRHGRRLAWVIAIVLQCVLVVEVVAAYLLTLSDAATIPATTTATDEQPAALLTGLLLPILVPLTVSLVTLTLGRQFYPVRASRPALRRLAFRLTALLAGATAVYLALGLIVRSQWAPAASPVTLLLDVPWRLAPLEMILGVVPTHHAVGPLARALVEWGGVAFWVGVVSIIVHESRRPASPRDDGRSAAQGILYANGGGPIAWMGIWPGNTYWFTGAATTYVPYRVVRGVALTTGDPVGPAAEREAALLGFTAFTQSCGWVPCFYSVSADMQSLATQHGWGSLQIAEEPFLHLGGIAFTGKAFQDLRSAFNAARRDGVRVEWIDYRNAAATVLIQIHAISEDWVARQALPEMGFTLGGLEQLTDPNVRCCIVVDSTERVHAVASWLPIHSAGAVTGWTLDFMRRRHDGFPRSVDLLIAQAILDLQSEGFTTLSLSGAPLARATREPARRSGLTVPPATPELSTVSPAAAQRLERLLAMLGAGLEPVYGFRSLLRFKAKFAPAYRPIYLLYPDAAALPAIARAVTGAYVPGSTLTTLLRVLHRITLHPRARRPHEPRQTAATAPLPDGAHQPAVRP